VACSGENTMAIKLDGTTGDLTKSHVVWKNTKAKAFLPSPLIYQGLVYVPLDKEFVVCLDVKTGKQHWKERLGDQFYASPVAGAGRVYIPAYGGVIRVVKAGATFELLAENDLGERIVASPALSDGAIFIRTEKHLFCIGER
jgi:outer membrane protein assembly factor BamB